MMSYSLDKIPQKRYYTIGEVGRFCDVKPHVLRYWEQEFPQLRPSKRRGNRRYYQHKDVQLIFQIQSLLYEQGYTIQGARQQLSLDIKLEKAKDTHASLITVTPLDTDTTASQDSKSHWMYDTIRDLQDVLELIKVC